MERVILKFERPM